MSQQALESISPMKKMAAPVVLRSKFVTSADRRHSLNTSCRRSLAAAENGGCAPARQQLRDRDDLERRQFAFGVAHRDVFAIAESVIAETKAGFRFVKGCAEFEAPVGAAAPAWAMHEQAALVAVVAPEAARETFAAMRLPRLRVDLAVLRQRRDEFVAVPRRALGKRL